MLDAHNTISIHSNESFAGERERLAASKEQLSVVLPALFALAMELGENRRMIIKISVITGSKRNNSLTSTTHHYKTHKSRLPDETIILLPKNASSTRFRKESISMQLDPQSFPK